MMKEERVYEHSCTCLVMCDTVICIIFVRKYFMLEISVLKCFSSFHIMPIYNIFAILLYFSIDK